MKQMWAILTICLLFTAINFAISTKAYDLSAFTLQQQEQLHLWYWALFEANVTEQNIPETGVKRGGERDITVGQITIQGEGNKHIVITPNGLVCFNEDRQVACEIVNE